MQYIDTPTKTSFNFHCITEIKTIKAIDTLENKGSSGHDGISNKIVKLLKNKINKPLTVIINQILKSVIFPDSFKTSKIVPLFNLFSTNIPYMEHHFHELILALRGLIFGIINALLH